MNFFNKKEKKDRVLIRVCIGCVIPHNSTLIGQGTYPFIGSLGKRNEQYYDYEINQEDLIEFLNINSNLLIKYQLLDVDKSTETEDDKNVVKPTTLRGWTQKPDK